MNQDPTPDPRPPALTLAVGARRVPLDVGTVVPGEGLGLAAGPLARVIANPQRPDVLGLQNLSARAWTVRLPAGETRSVGPQETIRLAAGIEIDFGGATGTVRPRREPAAPQPIERAEVERLAGILSTACETNGLTKDEYERLHARFFAHDEKGKTWTFGLRSKSWHKSDGGGWVEGNPPRRLFIAPDVLDQLTRLGAAAGAGGN